MIKLLVVFFLLNAHIFECAFVHNRLEKKSVRRYVLGMSEESPFAFLELAPDKLSVEIARLKDQKMKECISFIETFGRERKIAMFCQRKLDASWWVNYQSDAKYQDGEYCGAIEIKDQVLLSNSCSRGSTDGRLIRNYSKIDNVTCEEIASIDRRFHQPTSLDPTECNFPSSSMVNWMLEINKYASQWQVFSYGFPVDLPELERAYEK